MKSKLTILTLALTLSASLLTVTAAEKRLATPKGGRALDKTEPQAELVVEKDRTVTVHFYTKELKPLAATTQTVTVIAEAKSGKTTLPLVKKGDSLVSTGKLPEGDGYNLVVQFRQTAEAKPQNLRFKLDMSNCGGCKRAEYACTCGH